MHFDMVNNLEKLTLYDYMISQTAAMRKLHMNFYLKHPCYSSQQGKRQHHIKGLGC